MSENLEDRRMFVRFNLQLPVALSDVNRARRMEVSTHDISAEGLGLSSSQFLAPDTEVDMLVHVSDAEPPVYLRGQVMWSKANEIIPDAGENKYRLGVSLEGPDLLSLSRLFRVSQEHIN